VPQLDQAHIVEDRSAFHYLVPQTGYHFNGIAALQGTRLDAAGMEQAEKTNRAMVVGKTQNDVQQGAGENNTAGAELDWEGLIIMAA
jgi:hypothetical protein